MAACAKVAGRGGVGGLQLQRVPARAVAPRHRARAAQVGQGLRQIGLPVGIAEHFVVGQHHGGVPARRVLCFPGGSELAVAFVALAGGKSVGRHVEAVDAIVHHPAPEGLACCVAQVGHGAHRAVAAPQGHAPFDFLGGRNVVAHAQVHGVLQAVVAACGTKDSALAPLRVAVVADTCDGGARGGRGKGTAGGTPHRVGVAHGVARAVLVLHTQRHPEPGIEARGNAR